MRVKANASIYKLPRSVKQTSNFFEKNTIFLHREKNPHIENSERKYLNRITTPLATILTGWRKNVSQRSANTFYFSDCSP